MSLPGYHHKFALFDGASQSHVLWAWSITERLARRIDPEDIVQSAFRSFFRRAGEGNYSVKEPGDLWRLLATITVNKLRHQRERHLAEKRSIERKDSVGGDLTRIPNGPGKLGSELAEQDIVELLDELERVLETLEPRQREVVALRLEGWGISKSQNKWIEQSVLFDACLPAHAQCWSSVWRKRELRMHFVYDSTNMHSSVGKPLHSEPTGGRGGYMTINGNYQCPIHKQRITTTQSNLCKNGLKRHGQLVRRLTSVIF